MKYLSAIKDIALTIFVILIFFSSLSFIAAGKITVSQQKEEVITLIPMEAYLRGSIKIDEDRSITNWRNNKNIVHWKFNCILEGTYKVSLIHSQSGKDFDVIFSKTDQKLKATLAKKTEETLLGELKLSTGLHEVAFYAPEVPRKSKLPDIFSIIISKIN